jgi:hypothetical protein
MPLNAETPYVSKLVLGACNTPFPIPLAVINALMSKTDPLGAVHTAVSPKHVFHGAVGDRVRFGAGNSFGGLFGQIKHVLGDGTEMLVELEKQFLGQKEVRAPVGYVAEVMRTGTGK